MRIPESWKLFHLVFGILGFGIQNSAQGIRNPESGIDSVESGIQDCLGLPYIGERQKYEKENN